MKEWKCTFAHLFTTSPLLQWIITSIISHKGEKKKTPPVVKNSHWISNCVFTINTFKIIYHPCLLRLATHWRKTYQPVVIISTWHNNTHHHQTVIMRIHPHSKHSWGEALGSWVITRKQEGSVLQQADSGWKQWMWAPHFILQRLLEYIPEITWKYCWVVSGQRQRGASYRGGT